MLNFSKKKLTIAIISVATILSIITTGLFSVWYVLRPWNSDVNNLKGENIEITAFDDVKLVGNKHYTEDATNNWVILVHCYRGSKSTMSVYEKHYHESGYNTLCVDNRAHGKSEGDYIGMGYLDQFDIKLWVEYIIAENPDAEIILHGLSMGAAACMIYSGRDDVPENVVAVIEDSGYYSADSYLKWKLKQSFRLPSFPIINIANTASRIVAGYYLTDASAFEGVGKNNIPTLFIHGDNDMTVPIEDAYKLYYHASCYKELLIVEGAGHGEAVVKDEDYYWTKIDMFIKKVLSDEI